MSYKAKIIEDVFRLSPREGQFSIQSLALLTFSDRGIIPSISDQEMASKFKQTIFNGVLERQEALTKRGGLAAFDVVSREGLRLKWRSSSATERKHRQRIILRSCVARWLDELDDRTYELASGLAMRCLGASLVHVTPKANEFGIDFLAIVPAYTNSPVFVSGVRGIRIIGQSKKYNSPVVREKIQSFNDCLTSVRGNRAELINVIPAWFWGSSSPIVSCFVAHSGFQAGSREMARQAGHILLDTLELAEIIGRLNLFDPFQHDREIHRMLWTSIYSLDSAIS